MLAKQLHRDMIIAAALAVAPASVFSQSTTNLSADQNWRIDNMQFDLVLDGLHLSDQSTVAQPAERVIYFSNSAGEINKANLEQSGSAQEKPLLTFKNVKNVHLKNCSINASDTKIPLKLNGAQNVVIDNCTIIGGTEESIEILRGQHYVLRNVTFVTQGNRAMSVKGGVDGLSIVRSHFTGTPVLELPQIGFISELLSGRSFVGPFAGGGHFIELGNWSEYDFQSGRGKTRNVSIDATSFESKMTSLVDVEHKTFAVQAWPNAESAIGTDILTLKPAQIDGVGEDFRTQWESLATQFQSIEPEVTLAQERDFLKFQRNVWVNHPFFAAVFNQDDRLIYSRRHGWITLATQDINGAFSTGSWIFQHSSSQWFMYVGGGSVDGTATWYKPSTQTYCKGQLTTCTLQARTEGN